MCFPPAAHARVVVGKMSNFWNCICQPAQAKYAIDELLRQVRALWKIPPHHDVPAAQHARCSAGLFCSAPPAALLGRLPAAGSLRVRLVA